MTELTIKFKL